MLVVDTITWKPHVETSIEVALRQRDAGEAVRYANLRWGLPACEDASAVHSFVDLPATRAGRAEGLLRAHGVDVLPRAPFGRAERSEAMVQSGRLLETCRDMDGVRALGHGGFHDLGWGVVSSVITLARRADLDIERDRRLLLRYCAAGILVYERTRALLAANRPDRVLLFNGRFATTRAVLRAAEAEGVPWLIHERGGSKDRFWVVDYIPHDIDRLQAEMLARWPGQPEGAGDAFFRGRRERVEHGWHSHTAGQQVGRLPAFFGDADWVTFFTSSEDEMASIGDRFASPAFPTQEAAIRAVAEAVARIPGLRLCVRVHPHVARKSRADQAYWEDFRVPGVEVIAPSDPTDSYGLIDRSQVVCSYGSSVGIEATYWGRPSLLLARAYYDRLGVAATAGDVDAIEAFLRAPQVFPRERCLPCGAFFYTLGEPFKYYEADGLHRGRVCGVYLDDAWHVRLAQSLMRGVRRIAGHA